MSSRVQETPILDKSILVERMLHTDDGREMSFAERPYWVMIYNDWTRKKVLFTSRQAEKTTFIAKDMVSDAMSGAGDSSLYTTASLSQVKDFSNKKLRRTFVYNKNLKETLLGKSGDVINNVFDKQFTNGSTITMRHAGEDGENVRGNTARKIYIDEKQSVNQDAVPVIEECAASFPDTSQYIYAGTPLSNHNALTIDWERSSKCQWIIKCQAVGCGRYNEPLGESHIDENKAFLFCQYCGAPMKTWWGSWVPTNKTGKYPGYRIVRLMVPNARWRTDAEDGILDKLKRYPKHRFLNEVLALATDSAFSPITEAELRACCEPQYDFQPLYDYIPSGQVFAGLDWAMEYKDGSTSYTKLGIFLFEMGRIKLLHAVTYDVMASNDPEWLIGDIARLCNLFNVAALGADYGVGHKENIRLKKIMPDRVFEFQYAGLNEAIPKWDNVSQKYIVNRTISIEETFRAIQEKTFWFPRWETFLPYAKDILAEKAEYDPTMRRLRYDHPTGIPDDFLHVCNYVYWVVRLVNNAI